MDLFKFSKPVDKPTPSVTIDTKRVVELSYYDIAKILKIAEHVAYSLAHLNRDNVTFTAPAIGEMSRMEIAACMQEIAGQKHQVTHYSENHKFELKTRNVDNIRTMLFDFEVWLTDASKKLDSTGVVFYHVMNDFEHCRKIRRKLTEIA